MQNLAGWRCKGKGGTQWRRHFRDWWGEGWGGIWVQKWGVLAKLDSPHWSTSQAQRSHVRRGPICTTHRREDIKKGCGGTQAFGDPPCPIDPTTPPEWKGSRMSRTHLDPALPHRPHSHLKWGRGPRHLGSLPQKSPQLGNGSSYPRPSPPHCTPQNPFPPKTGQGTPDVKDPPCPTVPHSPISH